MKSIRKLLISGLIFAFLATSLGPVPKAGAAELLDLPVPGTMVSLSPAYAPVMIKGLTVHKDNPFLFDFIVDQGDDSLPLVGRAREGGLKQEANKLIKYFLASLTLPEKDIWVNLSPYEKDRTIPEQLSQTDMGRDLLAQDYILKQITASLIYPEKELGKSFWDKVYTKAQQLYGTTEIPVNTFNKVWIMADKAEVFEHNQTAFVTDSHLKVMLEEDYLALNKNTIPSPNVGRAREGGNTLASQIVRELILPELEKEVNTGKNFANLRQIFNSLILATWYKKNLKAALLNQVYSDKGKVKGLGIFPSPGGRGEGRGDIDGIYQRYLQAYKKGVFDYIKDDIDQAKNTTTPRKYFSGGMQIVPKDLAMTTDPGKLAALSQISEEKRLVGVQALVQADNANRPEAAAAKASIKNKAEFFDDANVFFPTSGARVHIIRESKYGYYLQHDVPLPAQVSIKNFSTQQFYAFNFSINEKQELIVENSGELTIRLVLDSTREGPIQPHRRLRPISLQERTKFMLFFYGNQRIAVQYKNGRLYLTEPFLLGHRHVEFKDLNGEGFDFFYEREKRNDSPPSMIFTGNVKISTDQAMASNPRRLQALIDKVKNLVSISAKVDPKSQETAKIEEVTKQAINQFFKDHKTPGVVSQVTSNGTGRLEQKGYKFILDIDSHKPSPNLIAGTFGHMLGFPQHIENNLKFRLAQAYLEHGIETSNAVFKKKEKALTVESIEETVRAILDAILKIKSPYLLEVRQFDRNNIIVTVTQTDRQNQTLNLGRKIYEVFSSLTSNFLVPVTVIPLKTNDDAVVRFSIHGQPVVYMPSHDDSAMLTDNLPYGIIPNFGDGLPVKVVSSFLNSWFNLRLWQLGIEKEKKEVVLKQVEALKAVLQRYHYGGVEFIRAQDLANRNFRPAWFYAHSQGNTWIRRNLITLLRDARSSDELIGNLQLSIRISRKLAGQLLREIRKYRRTSKPRQIKTKDFDLLSLVKSASKINREGQDFKTTVSLHTAMGENGVVIYVPKIDLERADQAMQVSPVTGSDLNSGSETKQWTDESLEKDKSKVLSFQSIEVTLPDQQKIRIDHEKGNTYFIRPGPLAKTLLGKFLSLSLKYWTFSIDLQKGKPVIKNVGRSPFIKVGAKKDGVDLKMHKGDEYSFRGANGSLLISRFTGKKQRASFQMKFYYEKGILHLSKPFLILAGDDFVFKDEDGKIFQIKVLPGAGGIDFRSTYPVPVRLKYLPLENHVSSTALVSGKDGPMALPENARVIFPAGNKEISIRRGVLPGNGSRYYIQPGVLPLRTTIRSHTGSKFYEFSFYLKDGKELMVKNSGQAKLKKVIVKPNGAMTRDPRIDPARYWQTQGLEDKDTIKISLYGQELVIQNRKGILYLVKALSLSSKFVEFEDLGGEKFQLSQQLSGAPTFVTPNDLVKVYPDEAMTTDQAINAGDNIFPFSSSADERTLQTIGRRLDKAREELDSAPSLSKERREVLLRELEQGQTHLKQYSLGGRGVQFEIYWRAAHLIRRAEFYMVELMRQGVPDEVVKRLEQEDNEVFKRGFKFTSDEKRMLALEMMGWAVGSAVAAFDLPHSFSTSSEVYFWLAFVIAGSGILTIKKRSNIKRDRIIFRGDSARKEFRDFINVNREITKEKRERGVFLLHKIERLLRYLKYFGYNRQKAEKIAERHLVLDQDGRFPKHVLNVFNRAWYQTVLRRGATISDDLLNNVEFMVHHSAGRVFGPDQAMAGDKAVTVPVATNGGIDLNAEKINWNIRKDGNGVEMNVNPALIERIKREGIESLTPVILRITPITSVWSLIGLAEPAPVSGIS